MKRISQGRHSLMGRAGIFVCLLTMLVLPHSVAAQHFAQVDDQRAIELAVDMIRKGIQQEDTSKILMVLGQQVQIDESRTVDKAALPPLLQTVFDNSSEREFGLARPTFPRADNPLNVSNLWDFDILDPSITIEGDSAFVACELVLWASVAGSSEVSGREQTQLVFYSPPKVARSGDLKDTKPWPASAHKNAPARSRGWQLVDLGDVIAFLESHTAVTGEKDEGGKP